MSKFKDKQNRVHEIELEFVHLLPQGCVQITDGEAVILLTPVPTLSERKAKLIADSEAAYDAAIQEPIAYLGTTFQADKASRELLTDVLVAAGFVMPTGFMWRDANNVATLVEGALLQGLATTILMRGQPLYWAKTAHKDAINACLTDEDLDLYLNPPPPVEPPVIPPEEPLP